MHDDTDKRCQTCRQIKPRGEFLPTRYTATGLSDNCRACIFSNARRNREQRDKNKRERACCVTCALPSQEG